MKSNRRRNKNEGRERIDKNEGRERIDNNEEKGITIFLSLFFLFPPLFSFRLSFSKSSNRTEIPTEFSL